MNAPPDAHDQQIIRSWNANAKPWTRAIQAGSIHSRKLVTDRAIVDAVLCVHPLAALASVIFICKAPIREQTDRMEQHQ